MRRPLTILVSGMIGGVPCQGGATWAVLQYLLGLRKLGHAVYFVEHLAPSDIHPTGVPIEHSNNARYFRQVVAEFGLEQNAALLVESTQKTYGLDYDQIRRIARSADLLLNISGMLADFELVQPISCRVYLDLDPAFNQLWQSVQGIDMRFEGHTHFVTVGLALGQPTCNVPLCGRQWMKTLQPVVLDYWPRADVINYDGLTTVGNWRGYGSIDYGGAFYGQRAHSLRRFIDLPKLTKEKFLLALAIHPDEKNDLAALDQNGWQLVDPGEVADTPAHYQSFIQGSKAEFGIAKSGYVVSHCGWFSDRSVCYLASGRPVIAQETGFSDFLPTGQGLIAFETCEDVLASLEALDTDYAGHARAAREIASDYFDSDKVLTRLLDGLGVA